jgi:hypothetical protein
MASVAPGQPDATMARADSRLRDREIIGYLPVRTILIDVPPVPDLQNPDLLIAEGEDHPPVSDPERPQPLRRVRQGFRRSLGVQRQLAFDGSADPPAGRRIEPGDIPGEDQRVVQQLVSGH